MAWKLFPNLSPPDWTYWEHCYPDGVGPSVFASPAWQKLMQQEVPPPWKLKLLQYNRSGRNPVSLPVFVRRDRWKRFEITVRPIAYYVSPLETAQVDHGIIHALIEAATGYFTGSFTWWLAPWIVPASPARTDSINNDTFVCRFNNAYLITLETTAENYITAHVEKAQRKRLRITRDRGLEILPNPSPDLIDDYYQLYLRVWDEQKWTGRKFSRTFFHGVARSLRQGGELLVMVYRQKVVGGGILLYDQQAVHTFQSAIDRKAKGVYPHAVFNARAIEQAQIRGLRYVNFGGINEGNEGLRRYKESWGAAATPVMLIRWYYKIPSPIRMAIHGLDQIIKKQESQEEIDG